jgi:hypothetical protein
MIHEEEGTVDATIIATRERCLGLADEYVAVQYYIISCLNFDFQLCQLFFCKQ